MPANAVSAPTAVVRMVSTPAVSRTNPARIRELGRRLPARRPASSAMANIVSDSGASEMPDCSAL